VHFVRAQELTPQLEAQDVPAKPDASSFVFQSRAIRVAYSLPDKGSAGRASAQGTRGRLEFGEAHGDENPFYEFLPSRIIIVATVTTDLENFANSFENEAALRGRLAKLFSKLPTIQGTQVTHGPQEYGKDLVFYSQDGLGDWVLNACVVKNDKITGTADGQTGGRNVLVQAEQALDTPHINGAGQEESVAHVYIISPYECSQTTMRSIMGKLKGRSGQITFLCGRLLLEKFAKYWPEFVAFETTVVASYIMRLQRSFDETDPISFLMSQHQVLSAGRKSLAKVYVRQRFRRTLQEFALLIKSPFLGGLPRYVQSRKFPSLPIAFPWRPDCSGIPKRGTHRKYRMPNLPPLNF
jgi:hypothetical protein